MSKLSKIVFNILIVIFFGIYSFSLFNHPVYSNTVEELEEQIAEKEKEIEEKESVLESVEARIAEISNSNYSVSQKINLLTAEITTLEESIEETEEEIDKKVKGIEEKQEQLATTKELIDDVSGDLYMESRYKLANFFLNRDSWSNIVETLFIKQSTISMLRREAEKIGGEFSSLAESKAELDKEKENLDEERAGLDEAYKLLADERAKLQSELSKQVAAKSGLTAQIGGIRKDLSELQNFLMLVRSGGTVVSAGSLISTNSLGSYDNFQKVAPAGSFGVFSFGAFTHRDGMSQYGAHARAKAGESYMDILSAYYPGTTLPGGYSEPSKIKVVGWGTSCYRQSNGTYDKYYDEEMNFSTYMNRIFEMPSSWNPEALKAQAIAARSYAIYQIRANGYVRPNQGDQVVKDCDNGAGWLSAVAGTKGMVLMGGGSVHMAKYAAVHGGWGNQAGWDTTDGTGSGDWVSRAWDNLSGTTWFYRNWFDYNASTGSYTPCSSHPNPWLTQEEMADIINAYKYWTSDSSAQSDDRVISIDFGTCFGESANPYSMSQMRSLVSNPVTSISAVYVSNSGGSTQSITFVTNAGNINIDPYSFKKVFSLRAPGYYSIPQSGFQHFNIVMR